MRKNLMTLTCLVAGAALTSTAQADRVVHGTQDLVDNTIDFLLGGTKHSNQGYLNGPEHSNQGGTGDEDGGGDDESPDPRPLQDPGKGGTGPSIGGDRGVVLGGDIWVSTGTTGVDVLLPGNDPLGDTPTDDIGFGDDSVVPLPEPTSLLLVSFAGLTLLRRRR